MMTFKDFCDFFKRRNVMLIEYSVMFVATVISILLLHDRLDSKTLLAEYSNRLTISGEYSVDNGNTFIPYHNYDEIDMRKIENLIIRGTFDQDVKAGHNVYMFLNYIEAAVYVNDRIVYTNDPDVAYCWDAIDSVAFGPHDVVKIELRSKRKTAVNVAFMQFLDRMCDSTKNEVLLRMLRRDVIRILGEMILLIIGIMVIQTYFESVRAGKSDVSGILSCGASIIVGAFSCFINADYITLLLPQFELLEYIDSLTQIYVVVFAISYLRRYMKDPLSKRNSGVILVFSYNVTFIYILWRTFSPNSSFEAMVPIAILGILAVPYFIILLINDLKAQSTRTARTVGINAMILFACVALELLHYLVTGTYVVDLFELGMLAFGIGQYIVIVEENAQSRAEASRARELESELMQSQINIMVSQIQPHFMYNALSTIRALINKNPEEARNAIDFFTKYIRANMDSLSLKSAIPFKKEMEHVESYLYIEKLRFGDKLKINYDIQTEDFKIPCMTVQTLAENAVKHGLLAKAEGGTLTIRSRETANCFEVQIEDNGVGFDTSERHDDSRSHVGIENSRKRLAALCGGTLSIGSKVGVGTTITITIPKVTVRDSNGIIEMEL